MNWKILAVGAVIVVPLVAVLASGFGKDPRGVSNALEGRKAPDFTLLDLDGQPHRLSDEAGHPVVINYWATWCSPCRQEHPHLLKAAEVYGPRGVAFYGVLYGDEADKARDFLATHGQAFPTLVDEGDRTAIDYGVAGVPEPYVIDANGTIVRKFIGPVSFGELAALLEPML